MRALSNWNNQKKSMFLTYNIWGKHFSVSWMIYFHVVDNTIMLYVMPYEYKQNCSKENMTISANAC